jgi:poly(beta-D-mannuronate) lyase
MRRFYDGLPDSSAVKRNNHRYWAGYAAAATAVVSGDRSLLDWAAESFKTGVCAVDEHGALPLELHRGARALGYMFYAAGPLVMIDTIAARNGLNIQGACRDGLERLMQFSVEQAVNPALIDRLTNTTQQPVMKDGKLISRSSFAWIEAYQDRLKAPAEFQNAVKASRPFSSGEFGGNTTNLFARR